MKPGWRSAWLLGALAALAGPATEADDVTTLEQRVARLEAELDRKTARRGEKLYARTCAACHGRAGAGDGPAADDLTPAPRDFTAGQFRFRTTASGSPPQRADVEQVVRRGLPGSAMPAFGGVLTDEEISALISFVLSIAFETTTEPDAVPLPELIPATPATVREGHGLYLLMECWRCHGRNGAGRGPSAHALTDEQGRRARLPDFRHDPFKRGRTPESVVLSLLTGLNGTAMPSYADALLFGGDQLTDLASGMAGEDRKIVEELLQAAPPEERIDRMDETARAELRDRRLGALAHYVLSLDRRRGFLHRLLHEQPEKNARFP